MICFQALESLKQLAELLKGTTPGVRISKVSLNWTVQLYVSFMHFDSLLKSQKRNNNYKNKNKHSWAATWAQLLEYSFRATILCFVFIMMWNGLSTHKFVNPNLIVGIRSLDTWRADTFSFGQKPRITRRFIKGTAGDNDIYLLYLKINKNLQENHV